MAFEDEFTSGVDGVLDVGYKLDELDGEVSGVICGTRSRICGDDRERPSAAVVRASAYIFECCHSAQCNVFELPGFLVHIFGVFVSEEKEWLFGHPFSVGKFIKHE